MKPFLLPVVFLLLVSPLLAADPIDYGRDIKPILTQRCTACHGAQKQRGGLRLDTAKALREGSNSGPVVVAGKSGASLLFKAVSGSEGVKVMPPKEPRLTAEQIALLKTWIDQGAHAPATEVVEGPTARETKHWAFQTPVRPREPAVLDQTWPRTAIDRFILTRLEQQGIRPAPPADRATQIRRLSLDLLGLSPSIQEVDEFLADHRDDAYERLVERLLQSPHYGERWGRHWLDLARYADSSGYNFDRPRSIWKYREWVIGAFNRDLPFDQFTIEQLAGDLLPGATFEQRIATGFHRNTLFNDEGGSDPEQFRVEAVVDRVNTTGAVYLGLTLGCAQCHDHKFDPVSQREFYQLYAFFNNADEPSLDIGAPEVLAQRDAVRAQVDVLKKEINTYDQALAVKQADWEKSLTDEARGQLKPALQAILSRTPEKRDAKQKKTLTDFFYNLDPGHQERQAAITKLQKQEPALVSTLVMQERATPRETYIQIRGDFLRKGIQVYPGVPQHLHALTGVEKPNRLDLARWIVDPKNPLTARVTMNRFWQHYFGVGLVETENDFGTRGAPPTHPELLDWLATEFIAREWSMKAMHRLIVTSATYRQSSRYRPELNEIDPRNQLLARQNRLRLEAEIIRDEALAASGLLARTIGGPSVFPPQPEGLDAFVRSKKNWKASAGPDRYRRGMYTHFWRSIPHPALTVFDAPDANTSCTRRNRSNTPLQALTLANDQAFVEIAEGLAARVLREAKPDDRERIRHAFRLCLAREPNAVEMRKLGDFLAHPLIESEPAATATTDGDSKQLEAWTMLGRVLLNLDEFITRE